MLIVISGLPVVAMTSSVCFALTLVDTPGVEMTASGPTLAVAWAVGVTSAYATAAAKANSPALIGVVDTVALFVASVWTVKPDPSATAPSHVAFVGAPIDAVGTDTAAPKMRPALPTSAVEIAVLFAVDSIVEVPVTPLIEAPDAPLAVTCALLVTPA
jgi:hypothetical protein